MTTPSRTGRKVLAVSLAAVMLPLIAAAGPGQSRAAETVTQVGQPKSGPGGKNYRHARVRVSSGGAGANAWYAFEPVKPRPAKAPVTVITHGYYEFAGYEQLDAMIRHTVRKGSIVIYPRWQTAIAEPCPGPIDIEPCIRSEVAGIRGALRFLRSSPSHVRPDISRASYFGFSFGGIVTANIANRWKQLKLPRPRAVFLDDPHDGGLVGKDEPALDDSLAGIPFDTLFQCHSSSHGAIAEEGKAYGSCNAVFPKLTSIPKKNKDLVLTSPDEHGTPALTSPHGVCTADYDPESRFGPPDTYDWGFCWKVWDSIRSCALKGKWCRYALGNTREHRHLGTWSDGVPVIGLKVHDVAPIKALPPPPRIGPPKPRRARNKR